MASQMAQAVENLPASAEDLPVEVRSLSWEDSLEEGMVTHSSILAWKIPWTEQPGLLQSIGSGAPLQYSCLENPMDGGAW